MWTVTKIHNQKVLTLLYFYFSNFNYYCIWRLNSKLLYNLNNLGGKWDFLDKINIWISEFFLGRFFIQFFFIRSPCTSLHSINFYFKLFTTSIFISYIIQGCNFICCYFVTESLVWLICCSLLITAYIN